MRHSPFIDAAVNQASAARRLRTRPVVERAIDTLAISSTYQMLGLQDRTEIRENIMELRGNFDTVLAHYFKYGGRYLPAVESGLDYRFAWMLLFIYVVQTRGGVAYHGLNRVFNTMLKTDGLVIQVSSQLLRFVSDYKAWEESEDAIKRILFLVDLPYRAAADFEDGGDILAVANLLGFTRARTINVNSIKAVISEEVQEHIDHNIPPMVVALLGDEQSALLKRAFAINAFHMESGLMDYVGLPCTDLRTAEVIRAMLQSAGTIPMDDADVDRMDVVRQFIAHARRGLMHPIPYRRDDELGRVFESRLGFNVYPEKNNKEQSGLLNSCTIIAISLFPEAQVKSLH